VLAVVAVVVGRFCRRPAVMHGLWLLVLLKLITPPLIDVPVLGPQTAAMSAPAEPVAGEVIADENLRVAADVLEFPLPAPAGGLPSAKPAVEGNPRAATPISPPGIGSHALPLGWKDVVAIVWLTGALAWFLLAGWRVARFRTLLADGRPASAELVERTCRLAQCLGLKRRPGLVLIPGRLAPLLWASGGRVLLCLPSGLVEELSPEAVETLLVHELAHYRRGDHWVRGVEFMALGLYWWNPLAWIASSRLREAEEQCCDAWVVATLPGSRRQYATALVDTLDYLASTPQAVPASASGLGEITDLKRRLRMILRGTTPRSLGWAGGLVVLGLAAVLPLWPRQAEAQDRTPAPPPAGREVPEDLQRLREALEQRMREVEELRARMAAAAEGIKRRPEAPPRGAAPERGDGRRPEDGGRGGVVIHIEVIGPEAAPRDIEAIVEKLKSSLPQGFKIQVHARRTEERRPDAGRGPDAGRPPAGGDTRRTPDAGPPPVGPDPRRGPEGGDAGRRSDNTPRPEGPRAGRDGDQRIEQLERRLEAVLHELEALRREMRSKPDAPGGRGTPPPERNPMVPRPGTDSPSR
jgi:beta-lactamase regulating signal transducer with metallopeptidase domain